MDYIKQKTDSLHTCDQIMFYSKSYFLDVLKFFKPIASVLLYSSQNLFSLPSRVCIGLRIVLNMSLLIYIKWLRVRFYCFVYMYVISAIVFSSFPELHGRPFITLCPNVSRKYFLHFCVRFIPYVQFYLIIVLTPL